VYTVVETPLFQRLADDHWSEEERSSFVSFIAAHPEAGNIPAHVLRQIKEDLEHG